MNAYENLSKNFSTKVEGILKVGEFKPVLVVGDTNDEKLKVKELASRYLNSRGKTYSANTVYEICCSLLSLPEDLLCVLDSVTCDVLVFTECDALSNSNKVLLTSWLENKTGDFLFIACMNSMSQSDYSPLFNRFKYII